MKETISTVLITIGLVGIIYAVILFIRAKKRSGENQQAGLAVRMVNEIAIIVRSAYERETGIIEAEVLRLEELERKLAEMGWQYREDLDQWVNGTDFIPAHLKQYNRSFESMQGGSSLADFFMGFYYPAYAN